MTDTQTIPPVIKTVRVPRTPDEAFEIFTSRIAEWWPIGTHSVCGAGGTVVVEPRVGGRVVETAADGTVHVWGTITAWSPGERLACTWHPGQDPETPTDLDVTFSAVDEGCEVRLVHSGWERCGDGLEIRARYNPGWDTVLEPFITHAQG